MSRSDHGPSSGQLMTQFAMHASSVADVFRAAFVKLKVGESGVDLTAPKESTGGGQRALQHIRLNHPSGLAVVVGHVDVGRKTAELRSYAWVRKAFPARFGAPCDFTEVDYGAFTDKARDVLTALGVEVTVLPDDDAASGPESTRRTKRPTRTALAVATALLVLLAVAWFAAARTGLLR